MRPLNKLGLIALVGLPSSIGMFYLFRRQVSSSIKSSKLCKEALETLKNHKGAVYLLGQPIVDLTAKYNSMGFGDEKRTDIKIDVSGPKSKGVLFYSVVEDEKNRVQLDSVQLQIGKDDSKRLIIKKSKNEINSNFVDRETNDSSLKNTTSSSENS